LPFPEVVVLALELRLFSGKSHKAITLRSKIKMIKLGDEGVLQAEIG
jgi:hypothetical protein